MTIPFVGVSSFVRCNRTTSFPLRWLSTPLVVPALVKPPVQRVKVDLEDEDAVE